MKGNAYVRGGDPMKTLSQRRKEKHAKLGRTKRVMRLKSRLRGIRGRQDKKEGNHHTTALMESYVVRRKAARAEEKRKEEEEQAKAQQTLEKQQAPIEKAKQTQQRSAVSSKHTAGKQQSRHAPLSTPLGRKALY